MSRGRVRARTYQALNQRTGGLLGIEKKFLDCTAASVAIVSSGTMTGGVIALGSGCTGCISAPAQGDTSSSRDGNKVVICEANVIGSISVAAQANQTAADTSCIVLLALVQDMQTNGVTLDTTQVFSNPTTSALSCADPFRNMSYTSRFKILKMKKITLRIPSITWDGTDLEQSGFHTNFHMKWKGQMPVTFTTASTTADVANVTDNSINVVAFCTNTSLAPLLTFNARTRFYG